MPTSERVNAFIQTVVSGNTVRAIEEFYHPNASMQENQHPLRSGKATLIKHEKEALDKVESMSTAMPKHVLIDGNKVVIEWDISFTYKGGRAVRIRELALQEWEGDLIHREQFFYDSKQLEA